MTFRSSAPRPIMSRLPLRFLTATSVAGLSLLLAPATPAQIGPATTEASDAPEPRFGMFRDPAGYEGSERTDPVDYNGEILALQDGELTLSLWKGVNGAEALEQATDGDYPGADRRDLPDTADTDVEPAADAGIDRVDEEAGGASAKDQPARVRPDENTRVYLNGRRAKLSDLRKGDRIRVRGVDPDGTGVDTIVALRTDDVSVGDGLNITPDVDVATGPASTAADGAPAPAEADPSIKRAAESGITTPGGGGFQDAPKVTPRGETKENLENPNRGIRAGGGDGSAMAPADDFRRAPGFGFAVADSPGEGVLVAEVQPGGPAAKAGVRRGDFLTRMDGESVNTPADVRRRAQAAPDGEDAPPVSATVWRDGEEMQVEMTPREGSGDFYETSAERALGTSGNAGVSPRLGARVRDSQDTGVEVLAGMAVGALAADAASERGYAPRTTGYRPGFGGYYPAGPDVGDYLDGLSVYDFAGGYAYGAYPVATLPTLEEQQIREAAAARALREEATEDALGIDAEDSYPGQYPPGKSPADLKARTQPTDRLMANDRIIGVNNRPVDDRAELNRAINNYDGDVLTLNVIRNGERMNLRLPKRTAEQAAD